MTKKLLLIRHASTGPEYQGKFIGSSDVPACKDGLRQVARLDDLLNHYMPQSWYCSPSRRAVQTEKKLRLLFSSTNETYRDEKLCEINFGKWEKKSFKEIITEFPEDVEGWNGLDPGFGFPGGEAHADFVRRVSQILSHIVADSAEHALVISHGGVIRTIICLLLGLDLQNYLLFDVRPAMLTVIDLYDDKGILAGLNL